MSIKQTLIKIRIEREGGKDKETDEEEKNAVLLQLYHLFCSSYSPVNNS